MNEIEFLAAFDDWAAHVRKHAIHLFKEGVPHDQIVKIAITIHDSVQVGRARTRADLAPGPTGRRLN